ncbi:MAG: DUF488 domain-containing protein [Opitutales bacterium]|jgi:hypothetical protein
MLFERQKLLLVLLNTLGGNASHLDYQKLLFLFCVEWEREPSYEFVPYKYGCFSFTSYTDIRKLIVEGYLADSGINWNITEKGIAAAKRSAEVGRRLGIFLRKWDGFKGDTLVAEIYRKYPYYAINSEMANRIFSNDEASLAEVARARPRRGSSGIYTIGYEGMSFEGYLNRLIKAGITVLCDVRKNPISRKYGFSKSSLSKGCESVGITYKHIPELGIASDDRQDLNTQSDYDALFSMYESVIIPAQEASINLIKTIIDDGNRIALTCFERLPQQCHRHCVANALERNFGPDYSPVHL